MMSRVEGFGLVYAEAMSYGVPILTSTEDASQYLNHEGVTGLSVCRDDHDAISDAVIRILADDVLHHRLSNGAFEHWANNFSFSAFAARFREAADPRRKSFEIGENVCLLSNRNNLVAAGKTL